MSQIDEKHIPDRILARAGIVMPLAPEISIRVSGVCKTPSHTCWNCQKDYKCVPATDAACLCYTALHHVQNGDGTHSDILAFYCSLPCVEETVKELESDEEA